MSKREFWSRANTWIMQTANYEVMHFEIHEWDLYFRRRTTTPSRILTIRK